jgi:hypothetical protein
MAVTVSMLASLAHAQQLNLTPGDVNGDGIVNAQDLALISSNWGAGYGAGDANGDGVVNAQDLALVSSNWLEAGPTFQQVVDSTPAPPASAYTSGYNASSLRQIGLTQAIAAEGNYGDGVTIGIVDTGIQEPSGPAFAGRISPLSTCAICLTYGIATGIKDTIGHGTVVAGVAAGANPLQIGVAPKAAIDVIGDSYDVGIEEAVNGGAKVINVSMQGAINSVTGINYAAGKGAAIVISGGNWGDVYNDDIFLGYSQQALSHIILVGAVTSANMVESWSSAPSYQVIGTTGTQEVLYLNPTDGTYSTNYCGDVTVCSPKLVTTLTGPSALLSSVWLMAPGDIPNEGSGTSFAAPYVTGAVALLESRWPILFKNGTTTQVLFDTATNLGDPSTYGNGLLNLTAAFNPIGSVSVLTPKGNVSVDQVVSCIRAGGPLGAMQAIEAGLTNYTVFDSFQRDFTQNLSYLISYKPSSTSTAQAMAAPQAQTSSTHFADGSQLAFGSQDAMDLNHTMGHAADENWFVSFTDASGSNFAAGQGFPASASFADSLWGSNSLLSLASSSLGISSGVASLAEGGMFTAMGTNVSKNTRVAFAWSETKASDPIANNGWASPNANAASMGLTTKITDSWTAGVSMSLLDEQSGLLGSSYDPNGLLNFGNSNKTLSFGVSSGFALADKTSLLLEAAAARTKGSIGSGLIESVSPLIATSYGASLSQRDLLDDGDSFSLSVKSPLKVVSGSASLITASVADDGTPILGSQRFSLKPNGSEFDLGATYQAPVHDNFEWNLSLTARHDADNIAGNTDVVGLVGAAYRF